MRNNITGRPSGQLKQIGRWGQVSVGARAAGRVVRVEECSDGIFLRFADGAELAAAPGPERAAPREAMDERVIEREERVNPLSPNDYEDQCTRAIHERRPIPPVPPELKNNAQAQFVFEEWSSLQATPRYALK